MSKVHELTRYYDQMEGVKIMKPVEVEDDLDRKFTEWQKLKRQKAILELVASKIGGRIGEIEGELMQVTKSAHAQTVMIDEAVVTYKTRKTGTTPKYKELFLKALSYCNEEQKAAVEELKQSMINPGISETLKIIDPELDNFLDALKYMDADELYAKLDDIKNIPDKAPDYAEKALESLDPTMEGIMDKFRETLKKWVGKIKAGIKNAFSRFKRSEKAVKDLLKVANQKV